MKQKLILWRTLRIFPPLRNFSIGHQSVTIAINNKSFDCYLFGSARQKRSAFAKCKKPIIVQRTRKASKNTSLSSASLCASTSAGNRSWIRLMQMIFWISCILFEGFPDECATWASELQIELWEKFSLGTQNKKQLRSAHVRILFSGFR